MTDLPNESPRYPDQLVRDAAVGLLAVDNVLFDDATIEDALAWARRVEGSLTKKTSPWVDGKHMGDCTKQPNTCSRCLIERYEHEARERLREPADD